MYASESKKNTTATAEASDLEGAKDHKKLCFQGQNNQSSPTTLESSRKGD